MVAAVTEVLVAIAMEMGSPAIIMEVAIIGVDVAFLIGGRYVYPYFGYYPYYPYYAYGYWATQCDYYGRCYRVWVPYYYSQ